MRYRRIFLDIERQIAAMAMHVDRRTYVDLHCVENRLKHILRTSELEIAMHTTKAFKHGNFQAVRIPAELAYARSDVEVEIERIGDEIRIRPARRALLGVLKKFAKFGPEFMDEGRGEQEQSE